MSEDKRRIAALEAEVEQLKLAISHNNDLIVGLERAFLDVVHTLVADNDDLQKLVLDRLEPQVRQFDVAAYKRYRRSVEIGNADNADTQLSRPAGLLSRYILVDDLTLLQSLKD